MMFLKLCVASLVLAKPVAEKHTAIVREVAGATLSISAEGVPENTQGSVVRRVAASAVATIDPRGILSELTQSLDSANVDTQSVEVLDKVNVALHSLEERVAKIKKDILAAHDHIVRPNKVVVAGTKIFQGLERMLQELDAADIYPSTSTRGKQSARGGVLKSVMVRRNITQAHLEELESSEDAVRKTALSWLAKATSKRDESHKSSLINGFPLFKDKQCEVVFDIGMNNGEDTEAFLKKGYCVIAVEANPMMVEAAEKSGTITAARTISKTLVALTLGIGEAFTSMPFYVTASKVHSSFDKSKAEPYGIVREGSVQTVLCDSLWTLFAGQPLYMKVDIEELHYTCIEAMERIPRSRLPKYISWEMHEYARGHNTFPVLDTELITRMFRLKYTQMKIVSNLRQVGQQHGGSFSGGLMPDDVPDVSTNSSQWRPVSDILKAGIGYPRENGGDWWDYHMKLEE